MTTAPTAPVEGLRPPDEGPVERERQTRKRLAPWDRIKFLVLFTVVWFILVWAAMADNPLLPFVDATRERLRSTGGWWCCRWPGWSCCGRCTT